MPRTRLLAELVDDEGHLDGEAWRAAHRDRSPVAICACGAPAPTNPTEPEYVVHFGVRWYSVRCPAGHTAELSGGKKLKTEGRPSAALAARAAEIEARKLGEDRAS